MGIRIDDTQMTSNVSGHRAESTPHGWTVTAFPGQVFTTDQAITAMVLAEVYAVNPPAEHQVWAFVPGWRAELGLTDEEPEPEPRKEVRRV